MAGNMDESQARVVAGKGWPSFTPSNSREWDGGVDLWSSVESGIVRKSRFPRLYLYPSLKTCHESY